MFSAYRRLVRFGFRLLYHEMAWTYDSVSRVVSFGEWRAWGRSALKYLNVSPGDQSGVILELAFGTGNLQLDFASLGYTAIGLDFSPQMARIAARKLTREHHPVRLVNGQGQTLPFASSQFAGILCTFPTSFIAEKDTLKEAHRVLQTEGRLVIVPGAVFIGKSVDTRGLSALYRATGQGMPLTENAESEVAAMVDSELGNRLREVGFQVWGKAEPCNRSASLTLIAKKVKQ
jgi:ubiquinone/menaquinone biosynthesis C-methylase UbiE